MIKCPDCGEEVQEDARRCKHCGRKLKNLSTFEKVQVMLMDSGLGLYRGSPQLVKRNEEEIGLEYSKDGREVAFGVAHWFFNEEGGKLVLLALERFKNRNPTFKWAEALKAGVSYTSFAQLKRENDGIEFVVAPIGSKKGYYRLRIKYKKISMLKPH